MECRSEMNVLLLVLACLLMRADQICGRESDVNPLRLFTRHADKRLSSLHVAFHDNMTVDACAVSCLSETLFECKSFTFDNRRRSCLMFTVSTNDRDVRLLNDVDIDHYETSYLTLFNRLPKHRMAVASVSNRVVLDGSLPAEECARRCVLATENRCVGFNFRFRPMLMCTLITGSPTSTPAVFADDTDYYQRQPDGALSYFINYGMGVLRPRESVNVYQKTANGLTLDRCSELCLNETGFYCLSFDFIFAARSSSGTGECRLSSYTAASVGGLVADTTNPQHNHYERIERYLSYFYAVPYGLLPSHVSKTFHSVTTEQCAELCVHEDSIICRSFDYQVMSGGECSLSEKTARDVGALDTNKGFQDRSHHFEMKPLIECGGNLTDDSGEIASPNWPRNYAHHQHCVWNITVSEHKIIRLQFTHFSLWNQDPSDAVGCTDKDDRVVIEETGSAKPSCVTEKTGLVSTKTNHATVHFISNELGDAQGFRAFYTADWPCNVYLQDAPGIVASPQWPAHYPPSLRCSWRVTAPPGHRVRLRFDDFNLDRHPLGHCSDRADHVRVLDGGTVSSPVVGLHCGRLAPFAIASSLRDLTVQFASDRNSDPAASSDRVGFYAVFTFEPVNGSQLADDDRIADSSRYVNVGGVQFRSDFESGVGQPDEIDSRAPDSDKQRLDAAPVSSQHSIWAAIGFLIMLVVLASVAILLLVHHYRQKLSGEREEVIEERQAHVLEDIPLRTVHSTVTVSPPHRTQHFNNEVVLSGADHTQETTCVASNDESPSPIYEQCGPPLVAPPRAAPRPSSSYGKYHSDNAKNSNAECSRSGGDCAAAAASSSATANDYV